MSSYVVIFFFFFKQKTAYEMRISDWSSDVCSSDLLQPSDYLGIVGPEAFFENREGEFIADLRDRRFPGENSDLHGAGAIPPVDLDQIGKFGTNVPVEKIGRASCRERVCQYV